MIEKATGQLVCGSSSVAQPLMAEDTFRQSKHGSEAEEYLMGENWKAYRFLVESEDGCFGVLLLFHDGTLHECHLGSATEGESWGDFSVENERERKICHDRLLARWLGAPPFTYPWGEVVSILDPKDSTALIIIRYAIPAP